MTCNPPAATNPQPPYAVIQSDVNDGYAYYDALDVNLSHRFSRRLSMLASYTWSHAIDNVDPDIPSQNPNDANFTGRIENGNAIFDQRQRFVLSGVYDLPLKIQFGGVATLGSGLPYNIHHRHHQQRRHRRHHRPAGDQRRGGGPQHRPRPPDLRRSPVPGAAIRDWPSAFSWSCAPRRSTSSITPISWATAAPTATAPRPAPGFGAPLAGITNQLPARSLQFSAKLSF